MRKERKNNRTAAERSAQRARAPVEKPVQFNIRTTPEFKELIRIAAARRGLTATDFVIKAVEASIAADAAKK